MRQKHWSAAVNKRPDLFWGHGRFRRRMQTVIEGECGISVKQESEAGTSSQCPRCDEKTHVSRNGDVFQCGGCGFEAHSDVVGSKNFLQNVMGGDVVTGERPMARPVDSGQYSPKGGTPYGASS